MKFFRLLSAVFFIFLSGSAQITKMYINNKGQLSTDSTKALVYVLIQKLDDSSYAARQFDMNNNMLMKCTFKDQSLKIPNGDFFLYSKRYTNSVIYNSLPGGKADNNSSGTDSSVKKANTYLKITGYFLNGVKTGNWIQYNTLGAKSESFTYKNDKLNGLYQSFNAVENLINSGSFVDDKKEGDWNTYQDDDQRPVYTDVFLRDKFKKRNYHLKNAVPSITFEGYISRKLRPYIDSLKHKRITVTLTLTEDGKIYGAVLNKHLNAELDQLINEVFLSAPKFKPCLYDNVPMKSAYVFGFLSLGLNDARDQDRYRKIADGYSRHTDDIGRGLNTMGIGRKVE